MDEFDYDAVIVGAGPIGGYLAQKLAKNKLKVLILEEHSEIGRPFQCAGLVNPKAMASVGLENTVLTPIWGARIYSPEGTLVEIGHEEKVRTWSVCRKLFDEAVVIQSIESGADIWLSSKPINLEIKEDSVNIEILTPTGIKKLTTKIICGADGAHSWVRRTMRMGRPKETMIGMQIEVTGYPGEEGRLDLFTGDDIAPGFFSWAKFAACSQWTQIDVKSARPLPRSTPHDSFPS